MYKLVWYIVGLVCILYVISHCYTRLINTYFIKSKCINYDIYLEQYIQVISDNNYYMNYGLWDKDNMLLMDANINLANFIFDKIQLFIFDVFVSYNGVISLSTDQGLYCLNRNFILMVTPHAGVTFVLYVWPQHTQT